MAAPHQRRDILKDVVPNLQQPTTWAALPPEAAVIYQRVRVVLTGLTGGACHLRAIRGGCWRRLTVIYGHSVTVTCAHSSANWRAPTEQRRSRSTRLRSRCRITWKQP
jgi:hypothetical protein